MCTSLMWIVCFAWEFFLMWILVLDCLEMQRTSLQAHLSLILILVCRFTNSRWSSFYDRFLANTINHNWFFVSGQLMIFFYDAVIDLIYLTFMWFYLVWLSRMTTKFYLYKRLFTIVILIFWVRVKMLYHTCHILVGSKWVEYVSSIRDWPKEEGYAC